MLLDRKGLKEDIWEQDGQPSHSLLRWEDVSEGKPVKVKILCWDLIFPILSALRLSPRGCRMWLW